MPETLHIETTVSGRYLVREPSGSGPYPLLAGFHGYGQLAEDELELLEAIAGSRDWLCCSIEALHPFYTRKGTVGASWTTRRNREAAIRENVRYVNTVIAELGARFHLDGTLVYHGFSHGAAMAVRAALLGDHATTAVMLLGGEIPPEADELETMGRVHISRGSSDRLYKLKAFERDCRRLEKSGLPFTPLEFRGGHAAGEGYFPPAAEFLEKLRRF